MKNSYIGQAWLVLMLAVCFGAALAGIDSTLKGRITQNKLDDTLRQIPSLVPGAESGEMQIVGDQNAYKALDADGRQVGWVLPAVGQGFADKIELLIGLNAEMSRVTGLYVLDQKETPGLGNKIVGPRQEQYLQAQEGSQQDSNALFEELGSSDGFRLQFRGKGTASPLAATKSMSPAENEIQAVTGATISSESVVSIINAAVTTFRAAAAKL